MTTYYQPMQRASDRRWDYTSSTGSTSPRPIGYCCGGDAPYHSDGHTTAEEAEACFRKYEAETQLRAHDAPNEQKRCVICDAWTTGRVSVGAFANGACCSGCLPTVPDHYLARGGSL